MDKLIGILIAFGSILGFLLVILAYTIRKYLLQRQAKIDVLTDETKDAKNDLFQYLHLRDDDDGFTVPITTRCVQRQVPNFGLGDKASPEKKRKKPHIQTPQFVFDNASSCGGSHYSQHTRKLRSPNPSVSSINEKEDRLVESALPANLHGDQKPPSQSTQFSKTERRISVAMLNTLALQGKQASISSRISLTEEMFIRDLEINRDQFLTVESNIDESSSIHSLPEVVDTLVTAGHENKKRRVIDRRPRGAIRDTPLKRTYKKSGKIKFTTCYLHQHRMLELHIHKAYDLKTKKDFRDLNTFVRVYLAPGKRQRKETQSARGVEPFFNEKIQFVDIDENNLLKYKIKLKLYSKERLKMKNELLGEVGFALNSIDINAKETFTPDLLLQRSESSLASVTILLCHQATFNKLEVTVQKAVNLPRMGISGQPSTYATVQLFKEDSVDKKETVVKKNSRDPVFMEMVQFDVDTDVGRPLSRYSLVISLIHKGGVVGKDEIIGHVIFSLSSPQKTAADHWKFICETPHQHLEQLHSLVDPDELMCSNEPTAM